MGKMSDYGQLMNCGTIDEMLEFLQSKYDTGQPLNMFEKQKCAGLLHLAPSTFALKTRRK